MLFHEMYGSYFRVVEAMLEQAAQGGLTEGRLTALVQEMAFAESVLSIPAALKSGDWPLLDQDLQPVLHHRPTMPLTTLEKRWLKALLLDPRIALFSPDPAGLEDVQPLYRPETFVRFDQYADADPYKDPHYIQCFRTVLQALREKRRLSLRFCSRTGGWHTITCIPCRLEYSAKDDKFRLCVAGSRRVNVINLARVQSCRLLEVYPPEDLHPPEKHLQEVTLLLRDERNALERVLLHFSHLEKETVKREDGRYEIRLRYDREDETELLIRVLSFGPVLEVCSPPEFIALVRERVERQLRLTAPPAEGETREPS